MGRAAESPSVAGGPGRIPGLADAGEAVAVLAADIGGTHARFALYDARDGTLALRERETYESARYDGLAPIARAFLDRLDSRPQRACLAVPAPVREGRSVFANLDWQLDTRELREALGIEGLRLVNDFDAVGHAVAALGEGDLVALQEGEALPHDPCAVIGAGTGLGCALLFSDGARFRVRSSEGGHAEFGPRSPREDALLVHLRGRYEHVSWERVVSGPGLVAIYRFLVDTERAREDPAVRRRMDDEDPAAVVGELGAAGRDPACAAALDLFVSAYGAAAGSLALLAQARGGVYVAGGIAPRILDKLREGAFLRAFRAKGRLSYLVEKTPVRVIVRPDVGLLGAAVAALEPPDARDA